LQFLLLEQRLPPYRPPLLLRAAARGSTVALMESAGQIAVLTLAVPSLLCLAGLVSAYITKAVVTGMAAGIIKVATAITTVGVIATKELVPSGASGAD